MSVGHTLTDGNYRMTLISNGIFDSLGHKLDGNADGVGGDNYTFDFFFFAGDANQARGKFADLVAVSQNYGKSGKLFSQGDFNYNGTVDFVDLVTVAQRRPDATSRRRRQVRLRTRGSDPRACRPAGGARRLPHRPNPRCRLSSPHRYPPNPSRKEPRPRPHRQRCIPSWHRSLNEPPAAVVKLAARLPFPCRQNANRFHRRISRDLWIYQRAAKGRR